jgi:hypothetical protein
MHRYRWTPSGSEEGVGKYREGKQGTKQGASRGGRNPGGFFFVAVGSFFLN